MASLRDLYDEQDIDVGWGGRQGAMTGSGNPILAPPREEAASPTPTAPPVPAPSESHVAGLMKTFSNLVERAQNAKYARTAEMYKGLAGIAGSMIEAEGGRMTTERGQDITAAMDVYGGGVTMRGQDIQARQGLMKYGMEAADTMSQIGYREGMMKKMAGELGLDVAKFGLAEKGLEAETSYKNRYLEILTGKQEGAEVGGMRKEIAASRARMGAGLKSIIATQGVPEMGHTVKSRIGGLTGWWSGTPSDPNRPMKSKMALETQQKAEEADIYRQYNVTPPVGASGTYGAETGEVPYWKRLLEGSY